MFIIPHEVRVQCVAISVKYVNRSLTKRVIVITPNIMPAYNKLRTGWPGLPSAVGDG